MNFAERDGTLTIDAALKQVSPKQTHRAHAIMPNTSIQTLYGIRLPYRIINSTIRQVFPRFASSVTPDELIDRAAKQTGIQDFVPPQFQTALPLICKGISHHNRSPLGRLHGTREAYNRICNRLSLERAFRSDTQLVNERIEAPWIILGAPRSGTTHLHRLLAQDATFRPLLYWESVTPVPWSNRDTTTKRISRAKADVMIGNHIAPTLKAKHEVIADEPDECIGLLANSLIDGLWIGHHEFHDWLDTQDKAAAYELHKKQLQYLQRSDGRQKTWLLKAPSHAANIESLLKIYPDACIIQLHRSPTETIPSTASLFASADSIALSNIDLPEVGERSRKYIRDICYSPLNAAGRTSLCKGGAKVIDVRYEDFMADALGTVASIYRYFDRTLDDRSLEGFRRYTRQNPKHRLGVHKYALEQFGLRQADIESDFEHYSSRYLLSENR